MNNPYSYTRLDKNNAAVPAGRSPVRPDHRWCRISRPDEFKNNVLALAALRASIFKLPTILTTSFENGPNGPLVPELKEMFPDAPYIARPGNINAWDNEDFVKAVKADRASKQLIIAGVVTEVCVAFPALSALEEGYEVFVVTDASGTFNEITRARRLGAHGSGRRAADELVRRGLRAAPRLAQRHRGPGRALLQSHSELPEPDHQLSGQEVAGGVPCSCRNAEAGTRPSNQNRSTARSSPCKRRAPRNRAPSRPPWC